MPNKSESITHLFLCHFRNAHTISFWQNMKFQEVKLTSIITLQLYGLKATTTTTIN
ncbi:hypothetical protein [Bartonella sp. OD88NMGDW]|uniref:hypothetical protein n=1 Tax=Bartonella sp. OD88NMGDW TaxID=3243571 RepID=UPI0035CF8947